MTALPATRRDDYRALHDAFHWNVPERTSTWPMSAAAAGPETRPPWTAWRSTPSTRTGAAPPTPTPISRPRPTGFPVRCANWAWAGATAWPSSSPQRIETVIAGMAVYQLGAVAMPLSMLFGPEALSYRIDHSEARVAIADETAIDNLLAARPDCPTLRTVIGAGAATGRGDLDWDALLAAQLPTFTAEQTKADEAAVLIYTSGTTGPPKGALLPHRALISNLTGFVCSQNWYPQDNDVFWSPADLGLDRRPVGCADAGAVLRHGHRRLSGPVLRRTCLRIARTLWRDQHLPVSHRAQADDEGVP